MQGICHFLVFGVESHQILGDSPEETRVAVFHANLVWWFVGRHSYGQHVQGEFGLWCAHGSIRLGWSYPRGRMWAPVDGVERKLGLVAMQVGAWHGQDYCWLILRTWGPCMVGTGMKFMAFVMHVGTSVWASYIYAHVDGLEREIWLVLCTLTPSPKI